MSGEHDWEYLRGEEYRHPHPPAIPQWRCRQCGCQVGSFRMPDPSGCAGPGADEDQD
jgi:hypothetical protein